MRSRLLLLALGLSAATAAEPTPEVAVPLIESELTTAAAEEVRPVTLAEAVQWSATTAEVDIARLDAAIAKVGVDAARKALLPQTYLTAHGSRSRFYPVEMGPDEVGPTSQFDAQVRLGQALLDLEALHRKRAVGRQWSAADAAITVQLEQAAAQASSAYVRLSTALARVAIRQEDLALAEKLTDQAKALVEAGSTERIAETRAASRVALAQSALTSASGAVQQETIRFARALGLAPGQPLQPAATLDATTTFGLPDDLATALDHSRESRPELRVASETLAGLIEARHAAESAFLPRIEGFAQAGYGGPRPDELDPGWSVGVSLTLPIYDRTPQFAEQARLRERQQQRQQRELGQRIEAEVRDAWAAITTATARLESDRAVSSLADDELTQAQARFEAGSASNLEVIDAQRNRTQAQETLLAATESVLQARIRLAYAMGSATELR